MLKKAKKLLPKNKTAKVVVILVGIGLGLFLLPFVIGAGISYLAWVKIPQKKLRYSVITTVALFTILFGYAWTHTMIAPTPSKPKMASSVSAGPVQAPVIQATPTSSPSPTATLTEVPKKELYQVTKVVDGDTIAVDIAGKSETIRLIGIDTPESSPTQCYAKEATEKARALLESKKVMLEADTSQGERDKYNRLLRYVLLENGDNFNKLMLNEGYAREYTYNIAYKYQDDFKTTEKGAKEAKKGLWSPDTCNGETSKATAPPQTTSSNTGNSSSANSSSGTVNTGAKSTIVNDGIDKDCKDFSTHAEAQAYFDSQGGSSSNNVDGLDADHDGLACESLK